MASNFEKRHITSFDDAPIVRIHQGIHVVRDDLYLGGTKARYAWHAFQEHDEIVYATPAEGGAQYALACLALEMGKKATLFVAKRKNPHPRVLEAKSLGATIYQVSPGYLAVVQARARQYCQDKGAFYLPFGAASEETENIISEAAKKIKLVPDQVWVAAGSGTLTRGLCKAFPNSDIHSVQVGRALKPTEIGRASLHISPHKYSKALACDADFPICPHYEAKAWEIMQQERKGATILFWNVAGQARSD